MMARSGSVERPLWRITIDAHTVGRHEVPAVVVPFKGGTCAEDAAEGMLRLHYSAHGVPILRSFVAHGLQFVRAVPTSAASI